MHLTAELFITTNEFMVRSVFTNDESDEHDGCRLKTLIGAKRPLYPLSKNQIRSIRSLTADKDVMFLTNDEHDESDFCLLLKSLSERSDPYTHYLK